MHYYYEGVCSWHWFYPYHYAPFASDLKGMGKMKLSFELGQPFKPFNQLLGVFPAASAHALPEQYSKLMADPKSPIIDFYPADFEVDMDGKRYAWQGVAKLPFIDEDRLLAEVAKIEHTLTVEENRRNSVMSDMLFVSVSHKLSSCIFTLADYCKSMTEGQLSVRERIDPEASGGMNGYISLCEGGPSPSVFRSPIQGMHDIIDNRVLSAVYHLPEAHEHVPRPPEGVEFPEKIADEDDIETESTLWHEDSGRSFAYGRNSNKLRNAMSRQHLGQSAKRLILNSIQIKEERNWRCSQIDSFHQPRPANTHSIYQVNASSGRDASVTQVLGHSQPGYAARPSGYRQPYSPPQVSRYEHDRFPNQVDNPGGKPVQPPASQQIARPSPPRAYIYPPQSSYAGAGHGNQSLYNQNVRMAAPLNSGRGFNRLQYDQGMVRFVTPTGRGFDSQYNQGEVRLSPTANAGRGFNRPQYHQGEATGRGFNGPQYNQGEARLSPTVHAGRGFNRLQYNQDVVRYTTPAVNGGRGFNNQYNRGEPRSAPTVTAGRGLNPQYNQVGVRLAAPLNPGLRFNHPPAAPANVGGVNNPRSPGSSVWERGAPIYRQELQDKDDGWIKVSKKH